VVGAAGAGDCSGNGGGFRKKEPPAFSHRPSGCFAGGFRGSAAAGATARRATTRAAGAESRGGNAAPRSPDGGARRLRFAQCRYQGRSAFPCPGCHRPVWITSAQWGHALVCEGCALEIVAPDPEKDAPARLVQPAARRTARGRAPDRRQVENQPLGENAAGSPATSGRTASARPEPAPRPPRTLKTARKHARCHRNPFRPAATSK
jgi:hypothetical protein